VGAADVNLAECMLVLELPRIPACGNPSHAAWQDIRSELKAKEGL
jgi:hypothetical protein